MELTLVILVLVAGGSLGGSGDSVLDGIHGV